MNHPSIRFIHTHAHLFPAPPFYLPKFKNKSSPRIFYPMYFYPIYIFIYLYIDTFNDLKPGT